MTVGITEMALYERLQRALRKREMFFASCRQQKAEMLGLGRYYIAGPNGVIDKDVDLENWPTT